MVEIRQYKIYIECMIQSESVKTPESVWKGNIEETGAGTGGNGIYERTKQEVETNE